MDETVQAARAAIHPAGPGTKCPSTSAEKTTSARAVSRHRWPRLKTTLITCWRRRRISAIAAPMSCARTNAPGSVKNRPRTSGISFKENECASPRRNWRCTTNASERANIAAMNGQWIFTPSAGSAMCRTNVSETMSARSDVPIASVQMRETPLPSATILGLRTTRSAELVSTMAPYAAGSEPQPAPAQDDPDQLLPFQVLPDHVLPDHVEPLHVDPFQVEPDQVLPDHVDPLQVLPDQVE